jgi:hypothetical protein
VKNVADDGETDVSHFNGKMHCLPSDAESTDFWILWPFGMVPAGAERSSCEAPIPPFRLLWRRITSPVVYVQ